MMRCDHAVWGFVCTQATPWSFWCARHACRTRQGLCKKQRVQAVAEAAASNLITFCSCKQNAPHLLTIQCCIQRRRKRLFSLCLLLCLGLLDKSVYNLNKLVWDWARLCKQCYMYQSPFASLVRSCKSSSEMQSACHYWPAWSETRLWLLQEISCMVCNSAQNNQMFFHLWDAELARSDYKIFAWLVKCLKASTVLVTRS